MHCLNCIRCMQNSTFETALTKLNGDTSTGSDDKKQLQKKKIYLPEKYTETFDVSLALSKFKSLVSPFVASLYFGAFTTMYLRCLILSEIV